MKTNILHIVLGPAVVLLAIKWLWDYTKTKCRQKPAVSNSWHRELFYLIEGLMKMAVGAVDVIVSSEAEDINSLMKFLYFLVFFFIIISGFVNVVSISNKEEGWKKGDRICLTLSFVAVGFTSLFSLSHVPWMKHAYIYMTTTAWFSAIMLLLENYIPAVAILQCIATMFFGSWVTFSGVIMINETLSSNDDSTVIDVVFACHWAAAAALLTFCLAIKCYCKDLRDNSQASNTSLPLSESKASSTTDLFYDSERPFANKMSVHSQMLATKELRGVIENKYAIKHKSFVCTNMLENNSCSNERSIMMVPDDSTESDDDTLSWKTACEDSSFEHIIEFCSPSGNENGNLSNSNEFSNVASNCSFTDRYVPENAKQRTEIARILMKPHVEFKFRAKDDHTTRNINLMQQAVKYNSKASHEVSIERGENSE